MQIKHHETKRLSTFVWMLFFHSEYKLICLILVYQKYQRKLSYPGTSSLNEELIEHNN